MTFETDDFDEYLRRLGTPDASLKDCEPDFLIISPSKTGTSWLSKNLSFHPEIFIPEAKEIHYFNTHFAQCDLNWYLRHFQQGIGRQKGEATPYAGIPLFAIQGIQRRFPRLKLIFMLRDPIQRAWSQAKHDHRHREGVFASYDRALVHIPARKFIEQFSDVHSINIGDYTLCLKRWLSCFGRDRIYVDFYESIEADPERLLRRVCGYLNVATDLDISLFPMLRDRIFAGTQLDLPARLRPYLEEIYFTKTVELREYLNRELSLVPPPEWDASPPVRKVSPRLVEQRYKNYDIFLYESKFYASRPHVQCANGMKECFVGHSLDEVKYYVDEAIIDSNRERYLEDVFTGRHANRPHA